MPRPGESSAEGQESSTGDQEIQEINILKTKIPPDHLNSLFESPDLHTESAPVSRPLRSLRWYIGGAAVSLDGHQLHRPPDAERARADPEGRVPLDEFGLRAHRHRVSRRLRVRANRQRPLSRSRGHAARVLDLTVAFYSAAAMLSSLAIWLARVLRVLPLSPRRGRVGELARRDQGGRRMVSAAGKRMGRGAVRQRLVDRRRAGPVHRPRCIRPPATGAPPSS